MGNYSPEKKDCNGGIKKSNQKIELLYKKLTKPGDKGQLAIVEEIAIEQTKIYLWERGYWIMREQQLS